VVEEVVEMVFQGNLVLHLFQVIINYQVKLVDLVVEVVVDQELVVQDQQCVDKDMQEDQQEAQQE
tara:strand:+ start:335 stop:529 length:195 start_codon:yes stop_codon:yes gene_type:complete